MADAGMPAHVAAQPIADVQADLQDTRTVAVSAEALVLVEQPVRAEAFIPVEVVLARVEQLVRAAAELVLGAAAMLSLTANQVHRKNNERRSLTASPLCFRVSGKPEIVRFFECRYEPIGGRRARSCG